jgi:hypothetical protein
MKLLQTCLFFIFLQFSAVAMAADAPIVLDATPENLASTPWAKLKIPQGTKLVVTKGTDGKVVRTLKFSGGVTISDNGISEDHSGKGAVECAWGIYVEIGNALEICSSEDNKELKKNLNGAIDRINDFIVVNSLVQQSKTSLEDAEKIQLSELRKFTSKKSKEELHQWCTSGDISNLIKAMKSMPSEKFKSGVDDLLSIPRPPVINPCL